MSDYFDNENENIDDFNAEFKEKYGIDVDDDAALYEDDIDGGDTGGDYTGGDDTGGGGDKTWEPTFGQREQTGFGIGGIRGGGEAGVRLARIQKYVFTSESTANDYLNDLRKKLSDYNFSEDTKTSLANSVTGIPQFWLKNIKILAAVLFFKHTKKNINQMKKEADKEQIKLTDFYRYYKMLEIFPKNI